MRKYCLIYIIASLLKLSYAQQCDTNLFPDGKQYPDTYHHVAGEPENWGHYNTHDPSVYKDGDWYYMYSTDAAWGGLANNGALKRRSKDLVNWEFLGTAFNGVPQSAQDFFKSNGNPDYTDIGIWAPFLYKFKDQYLLYYSAPGGLDGQNLAYIGFATSDSANGPWTDQGEVVHSLPGDPINAIDPTVVYDSVEKKLWMAYGSWWTGIYIMELDTLTGGAKIQGDKGVQIAKRTNSSYGQEGPELVYRDGWYYLFLVYDPLGDIYNVRVGRSKSPEGPYLDINGVDMKADADSYPMILGPYQFNHHPGWQGTGHCGVYNDEGNYYFFAQGRPSILPEMMVLQTREMFWIDGWPVLSPEQYAGVPDCPVVEDSLIGTWEHMPLIYNNNTGVNYRSVSQLLTLEEGGTFNKDVANTWYFDGDTLFLNWSSGETNTLVVEWGWDWENGCRTIIYTGLSSNTKCIWGKKIYPSLIENYTTILEGGTYTIRNALSNLLLQPANGSDGASVNQWSDNGSKEQLWKIKSAGDDYYYLLPQHTNDNLTLEVNGGTSADGSNIVVKQIDGRNRQKFKIQYHNNGLYRITSMVSNNSSALDVEGFSVTDGRNVFQWSYLQGLNQQWRITRIDSILADTVSIDTFPYEDPVVPELTIVSEPFNYDFGTVNGKGSNTGGWSSSWSITGPEENVQIVDGLNYNGLSTTGNSLEITAQDDTPTEAIRSLSGTWLDIQGEYWLSVLFEVENPTSINDSWQGISLENGGEQAYIGKLWGIEYVGINDPSPYLNNPSSTSWSDGLAYIVVKMVMSGDDEVDTTYMWVNPDPANQPSAESADIIANITLNTGFNAIKCHLGQTAGIKVKIDELRLSESWEGIAGNSTAVESPITNRSKVKAYPNPFTDEVTIQYSLLYKQNVRIDIFTTDGRVVKTIEIADKPMGTYSQVISADDLEKGLFFYRIIINNDVISDRLIYE